MGNRCEQGLHSRYTAVGDLPAWGPAGGRQGVPDEGRDRMMSHVFPWTGLGQGCLRDHFRRAGDLKNEGK